MLFTPFLTKFTRPASSTSTAPKFPKLIVQSFSHKDKIDLHTHLKLRQLPPFLARPKTVLVVDSHSTVQRIIGYGSLYHHFQQYGYQLTFLLLNKSIEDLNKLRSNHSITVDFLSLTIEEANQFQNMGYSLNSTFLLDEEHHIERYDVRNMNDINSEVQAIFQQIEKAALYRFKM